MRWSATLFRNGTFDLYGVYLGDRLGFYRSLAERGPSTAGELAEAADINPRAGLPAPLDHNTPRTTPRSSGSSRP